MLPRFFHLQRKAQNFIGPRHILNLFFAKKLLCQATILAYPRFDQPFVLQTDASDEGLGAVLTQIDAYGNERVISYASRPLTNREKGYSATENEALAVVFATDYYRVYLLGKHFTLVPAIVPFAGFIQLSQRAG